MQLKISRLFGLFATKKRTFKKKTYFQHFLQNSVYEKNINYKTSHRIFDTFRFILEIYELRRID